MERKHLPVQSEDLYRSVVDACPDGVIVADLDGTIIAANPAAAGLHGYEQGAELVGTKLFDVVSPEDWFHLEHIGDDLIRVSQVSRNGTYRLRHRTPVTADVRFSTIRDEDGNPLLVVAIIRDTSEARREQRRLQYQALHDRLTGLPNRVLLYDRLEHALEVARRSRDSVSLLVLDLNGLKEVNDRYGHTFGDALLVEIAARLQGTLRRSDTLGRLDGDTFAIVVADEAGGALRLADRVHGVLRPPVIVDHLEAEIGANIGIACYPVHGENREELFHHARSALDVAKRERRQCVVYSPESEASAGRSTQ